MCGRVPTLAGPFSDQHQSLIHLSGENYDQSPHAVFSLIRPLNLRPRGPPTMTLHTPPVRAPSRGNEILLLSHVTVTFVRMRLDWERGEIGFVDSL